MPPLSTVQNLPEGTLDLGDLNLHVAVPIVNKAGRGAPFDGGADTPLTVALATATAYFSEISNALGAAAATLKSYANGNYRAMGTFDWTHFVALATEIAASNIPGVSKYGEVLGQVADQGLNIAVSSPLVCQ